MSQAVSEEIAKTQIKLQQSKKQYDAIHVENLLLESKLKDINTKLTMCKGLGKSVADDMNVVKKKKVKAKRQT